MKTVTYQLADGTDKEIEYDENAPCILCGEPVISASVGGTVICPWCDMGKSRREDGLMPPFRMKGDGIHPKALAHYGEAFARSFDPDWIGNCAGCGKKFWPGKGNEPEEVNGEQMHRFPCAARARGEIDW